MSRRSTAVFGVLALVAGVEFACSDARIVSSGASHGGAGQTTGTGTLADPDPCLEIGSGCSESVECCGGRCEQGTCVPLCQPGEPPRILAEFDHPISDFVLDGDEIYVSTFALGGQIMRLSKSSGDYVVLADELPHPAGIAVNKTDVFWADSGRVEGTRYGSVWTVARSGGPSRMLVGGLDRTMDVIVDETRLVFSEYESGVLTAVPLDGSDSAALATGQSVVLDLVLREGYVYWSSVVEDNVTRRVPVGGGQVEDLSASPHGSHGFALDATHLYIGGDRDPDEPSPTIVAVSLATGETTRLGYVEETLIRIAVDETHLYFTDWWQDRVHKLDKRGGEPITIATNQEAPSGIAIDDHCVYWANAGLSGDRRIMRAPK